MKTATPRARGASLAGLMMLTSLSVVTPAFADPGASEWEQVRFDDGIRVSRKEMAGSPFVALRGEGDVDAPLLLVGSVLVDIQREKEWMDSVVEARVLRAVGEEEYVTYSHVGTPITMADRDFVTDVQISVDPAARRLGLQMHSVDDPAAPKTHYVRGELTDTSFTLTSIDNGRRTHVVAEVHCDPKGHVAGWIVNLFQKNWGYKTLRSLRTQVGKADVSVHPKLKSVLEQKGFFG